MLFKGNLRYISLFSIVLHVLFSPLSCYTDKQSPQSASITSMHISYCMQATEIKSWTQSCLRGWPVRLALRVHAIVAYENCVIPAVTESTSDTHRRHQHTSSVVYQWDAIEREQYNIIRHFVKRGICKYGENVRLLLNTYKRLNL